VSRLCVLVCLLCWLMLHAVILCTLVIGFRRSSIGFFLANFVDARGSEPAQRCHCRAL
jgi:hypothetical protein